MSDALELKLVIAEGEINGEPFKDFLIADKDASEGAVMIGQQSIYCQVHDELTGKIFVKSVNCFPELLECCKDFIASIDAACLPDDKLSKRIRAAIAKAEEMI